MFKLKTAASFDSAHFLKGYEGKCSNIHGHRWTVEVTVKGDLQDQGTKRGMVIDFGDLKNAVNQLADSFDHTLIYEENSLSDAAVKLLREEGFSLTKVPFRPTAENFAAHFYKTLRASGLEVSAVKVYETPNNCAVYEEDK